MKLTKKSPITLVELPPTQYGILNGDAGYDIYSFLRYPSRAIHVLEGLLRHEGFDNIQSINPNYHGKKGRLTEGNYRRIFDSNALLISSITRTAPQSMRLAREYKSINPKGIVIAGGFDPTFRHKEWLDVADIVVRGEGEKTLKELMERLLEDPVNLSGIQGIAYKNNQGIILNAQRQLLTPEELSDLPLPYYDKVVRRKARQATLETSRGCPYACEQCSVTAFYGNKFRVKSIDRVISELNNVEGIGKSLFITDDNFAGRPEHTISLLDRIIDEGISKRFFVQVSVAAGLNDKLLKALKNAGVKGLFVGFESNSDETLHSFSKPFSWEQNKEAARRFRDYGFWVLGMLMPGGDGDTNDSLNELSEWAKQYLDSVQYFPPVPIPGTLLREKLKQEGRLLRNDDVEQWSLYDGHHVLIRPKNFTPYELQQKIYRMYQDFYSPKRVLKIIDSPYKTLALTVLLYVNFIARKKILNAPQSKAHLEFLRGIS